MGEDVRRAALKKLFSDPRFNVMDGLDVYIDDYSKTEPIPPAMMAGLRQAQNIFKWAKEDEEQRAREEAAKQRQLPNETVPAIEPPTEKSVSAPTVPPGNPDTVPAQPGEALSPAKSR